MDFGIGGRVAVVGGSSAGLGRAVAEELAAEGCEVVISARTEAPLHAARDAIAAATGARVEAVVADLATEAGCHALIETAERAFGRVDILVTNTAGPPAGLFDQHSHEAWQGATALLLESVIRLARLALPGMRQRGWGRIITINSIASKQPIDGLILSNTLRAGVTGFARTLANEEARSGITVNNVLPGYTRTERLRELAAHEASHKGMDEAAVYAAWAAEIPLGRLAEPRELAALVAFLASERASSVTGQTIAVDGGWIRALL